MDNVRINITELAEDFHIHITEQPSSEKIEYVHVNISEGVSAFLHGFANITVGNTAPINPSVGDLWVDTS